MVLASLARGVEAVNSLLRAHCQDRLQRAAVPAVFEVLEGLPQSAAGKVDRSALPLPKVWASVGPDTASSSKLQGEACMEPGSINISCGHPSQIPLVLAQQAQTMLQAMLWRSCASDRSGPDSLSLFTPGNAYAGQESGPEGWEVHVLKAFRQALGQLRLEPAADFWAAGGTSLAAAHVANSLGIEPRLLAAFPTARSLATHMKRASNAAAASDAGTPIQGYGLEVCRDSRMCAAIHARLSIRQSWSWDREGHHSHSCL